MHLRAVITDLSALGNGTDIHDMARCLGLTEEERAYLDLLEIGHAVVSLRTRMRSRWRTGALAFAVWLLLAWPADAEGSGAGTITVVAGLAVAALAMATRRGDAPAEAGAAPPADTSAGWSRWLDPRRILWAGVFVAVFLWQMVVANFDVAYRILHPNLPIQPGIVKFRTALRSRAAAASGVRSRCDSASIS